MDHVAPCAVLMPTSCPCIFLVRKTLNWMMHAVENVMSDRCVCRGLCQLRWMAWEDVPAAVRQLYLRRWPKLNLNAHLACLSCQAKRWKSTVPKHAMPDVALDWEEFRVVPASAWRIPAHTHRTCTLKQSATKGMFIVHREWNAVAIIRAFPFGRCE